MPTDNPEHDFLAAKTYNDTEDGLQAPSIFVTKVLEQLKASTPK